jgi:thymidylate kinase
MEHHGLPKLIHFFGPDGSGKTTQAALLMDFMNKKGIRVCKLWVRSPHTVAYLLWKWLVKIGFYRIIRNEFNTETKIPAVNRNRLLQHWWSIVEFLSVLPHIFRAKILIYRGYTLIADRYILDTITSIAFFINDTNFLKGPLARLLIRFISKGSVLIFIDADFETILRRRVNVCLGYARKTQNSNINSKRQQIYGTVYHGLVEPREFIDFQRNAYRLLARSLKAHKIYSPHVSVEKTFKSIVELLKLDQ